MKTPTTVLEAMRRYRERIRNDENKKAEVREKWLDYMERHPEQREKKREYDRERYYRMKQNARANRRKSRNLSS